MKFVVLNWFKRPDLGLTPKFLEVLAEHMAYMERLERQGVVSLAGGFRDWTGGMDIIETTSKEKALEISHNDPLMKANLITQDIKPFEGDKEIIRRQLETLTFDGASPKFDEQGAMRWLRAAKKPTADKAKANRKESRRVRREA